MENPSHLGPPSLKLGGLRLWLRGHHFPWEEGFWSGEWLVVTAQWCSAGAEVRAQGPFLHSGDLPRWFGACERLLRERSGMAMLWTVKPEVQIALSAAEAGPRVEVRLSPDPASQEHVFRFQPSWEELEVFTRELQRLAEPDPLWRVGRPEVVSGRA